jgi:carbon-monoxide dehydrogenase large subunit
MNLQNKPPDWSVEKFGVGQAVPRTEDPKLLRGEGRYTDDINLPHQAYAVIIRSQHAHGVIKKIDSSTARGMPGVLGIWTGADLKAAGYGTLKCITPFPNRDGTPMRKPARPPLAVDKARWAGDPIAFVVAETVAQARDAAEAVEVDIEALPAVTDAAEATKPGAPQIFDDVPNNISLDYHYGDAAKVEAAFKSAAHVTKLALINTRLVVNAMEPRSAIGEYDTAADKYTLHVGSQGVFGLRGQVADLLNVKPDRVRVLTGNVGGSFGMKAAAYPEYACLFHAAKLLKRPVKWTDARSESFLSDTHGRNSDVTGELALDKDGNILALRLSGYANCGAYLSVVGPLAHTLNAVKNAIGVYKTPLIDHSMKCVFTNTTPVGPYRGAGRPEANYYMERLMDTAAAEMGIDKVELRRRNHIKPAQIPYKAPSDQTYDSGDFPTILEKALQVADWKSFDARKADSKKRGKLRGRGISDFLEVTAPPNKEMGGVRFEADGTVTIITGTLDYGQGHAAPFAQVLSQRLGIPFERIRLLQGDSNELIAGGGTGGSRSAMNSGAAIVLASDKVIENGRALAAHVLEAAAADIEFKAGRFAIAGTDRGIGIMELADRLRGMKNKPADLPSLDVKITYDGAPSTYPNGCHIAEVEVDPDTGQVEVVKYSAVNDFGVVINPLVVDGQLHGGVVQGIGQALLERAVYNEDGQLVTGSYMDYGMPRAADVPSFTSQNHVVPATTNPLGVKGCGEAGCAGSFPAVMNAVVDALREYGVRHIDMPATPERVWQAIRSGGKAA